MLIILKISQQSQIEMSRMNRPQPRQTFPHLKKDTLSHTKNYSLVYFWCTYILGFSPMLQLMYCAESILVGGDCSTYGIFCVQ